MIDNVESSRFLTSKSYVTKHPQSTVTQLIPAFVATNSLQTVVMSTNVAAWVISHTPLIMFQADIDLGLRVWLKESIVYIMLACLLKQ